MLTATETKLNTEQIDVYPSQMTLNKCVFDIISTYLKSTHNFTPTNLYKLVLQEVEIPLIAKVLSFTRNNQLKAAIILGLSRGTFRKKLKTYKLLSTRKRNK